MKQRLLIFVILLMLLVIVSGVSAIVLSGNLSNTSFPNTLSFPGNSLAAISRLQLFANIETIGVVVTDDNLPEAAELWYRKSSNTNWHIGHPLVRIEDGRLVGSVFEQSPATFYDIKVIYGTNEVSGSVFTQPDELQFLPEMTIYVDDGASSGGDGSKSAPYKTIQEGVNNASPGTRVLVADGVYHEEVEFQKSGSENNWIQVVAEGDGAILDGSEHLYGDIWTPHAKEIGVWFTDISNSIGYLARDKERFYRYDDLAGLLSGLGHNNVPMDEGWYIGIWDSTLYVRSLDNPANHTWQVPRFEQAFYINNLDWIWIEGFIVQFFGVEDGHGVHVKNASQVVIRKNKIHNLRYGIIINWTGGESRGNNSRVEYNEITDSPVSEWPWQAVKGTSMEGSAIIVSGHKSAIVRGNEISNFFNGIYTGRWEALENPEIAFDVDVYNNQIYDISDDGLEPEGACINQRFRNNTVDRAFVGISLAPITYGPTWVLRSLFTNYYGTSIKWGIDSDGIVLIYHNTSWTDEREQNAMTIWGPVHNAVMRNNIFRGTRYAFEASLTGCTGHDWNNNNWFTIRRLNGPHFKWENIRYENISELCMATGLECNGLEVTSKFKNAGIGDFTLRPLSPNIDRGVVISGINDNFNGAAPDIGVYESDYDDPCKTFIPVIQK